MEKSAAQIRIQVLGQGDQYPTGYVDIRKFSSQEILKKILKTLGIYWGLAVACIFLPVVHFVLVPLLLFLGLLLAVRARNLKEEIIKGLFRCPHCSQDVNLEHKSVLWPHTEICPHCAFVVRIDPIN